MKPLKQWKKAASHPGLFALGKVALELPQIQLNLAGALVERDQDGELAFHGHPHDPDPNPLGQSLRQSRAARVARPAVRASWLDHGQPGLAVRYEDLRTRPRDALRRLLHMLGLPIPDARIDAAIAACDVKAMRAMQEREIQQRIPGRFYDPAHAAGYKAGLRFVGPAKMGDLGLPPAVRAKLAVLYAEPMARLGYSLAPEAPPVGPPPPDLSAVRPLEAGLGLQVAAPPRS